MPLQEGGERVTIRQLIVAHQEVLKWLEWERDSIERFHAYAQMFGCAPGRNVYEFVLEDALRHRGYPPTQFDYMRSESEPTSGNGQTAPHEETAAAPPTKKSTARVLEEQLEREKKPVDPIEVERRAEQLRREVEAREIAAIHETTENLLRPEYRCPHCKQPGLPSIYGDFCTACGNTYRFGGSSGERPDNPEVQDSGRVTKGEL